MTVIGVKDFNPWDVISIYDFNFFCCPECDGKSRSKQEFINHASISHPQVSTGKSLSEALIFALTNPQYCDRLFIELQVQYMKIPSSNLGRTCCVQKLFLKFRTIFVHNMFSPCFAKKKSF